MKPYQPTSIFLSPWRQDRIQLSRVSGRKQVQDLGDVIPTARGSIRQTQSEYTIHMLVFTCLVCSIVGNDYLDNERRACAFVFFYSRRRRIRRNTGNEILQLKHVGHVSVFSRARSQLGRDVKPPHLFSDRVSRCTRTG